MSWSLIASTSAAVGSNGGGSTSAIDTRGADLIVVGASRYTNSGANTALTFTDSAGNTWTALTDSTSSAGSTQDGERLYYCVSPTTSATHTWTADVISSVFGTLCVMAFSGSLTSGPLDQQNGAGSSGTGTSIQPGSITPTQDNELIVVGLVTGSASAAGTTTLTGYTKVETDNGGNNVYGGLGYKVLATAAAENPTWSWTVSHEAAIRIVSFKGAAAGGGGGGWRHRQIRSLMGIGG